MSEIKCANCKYCIKIHTNHAWADFECAKNKNFLCSVNVNQYFCYRRKRNSGGSK